VSHRPSPDGPNLIGYDPELFQGNVKSFQDLATEDDIDDLNRIYMEYFSTDSDDLESDPLLLVASSNSYSAAVRDTSGTEDIGINEESTMDPETLATRLGFVKNGLPHQFNPHRHNMGLTSWSNPSDFENPSSGNLIPTSLHWHQLAGVHSILKNTFTAEAGEKKCTGTLVCDEVGLGKTTLVIATIAFLNQCLSPERKGSPPPVLGAC
jgi:hypothetical protein